MKHALEFTEHDTKASILVVAERLFAEIGFQKTTVSDIARELRMSPARLSCSLDHRWVAFRRNTAAK
jgi:AcrR family transcriptional regulator